MATHLEILKKQLAFISPECDRLIEMDAPKAMITHLEKLIDKLEAEIKESA